MEGESGSAFPDRAGRLRIGFSSNVVRVDNMTLLVGEHMHEFLDRTVNFLKGL